MPSIDINLDGDNAWDDLREKFERGEIIQLSQHWRLATLSGGMKSGKPSIGLLLTDMEGNHYFAETSVELWYQATAALRGKYG